MQRQLMLVEIALTLALLSVADPGARAGVVAPASCRGPQGLQARARAHPGAETYTALGSWFGEHENYRCAIASLQLALKFEPHSAHVLYLIGLTLLSSGQTEGAMSALKESVRLAPGLEKPHLLLATALTRLGQKKEAETEWRAALKLSPNSAIALDGLSNAWTDDGDTSAAIDLLRAVPRDDVLNLDLAHAFVKAGMLDEAAATLIEALEKNSNSLALSDGLVSVYVNQARYQQAARLAQKMVDLYPENLAAAKTNLRVIVLAGNFTVARPLGRKLLASAPHDFDLLYLNGLIEQEGGDYPAARTHLQEALTLDPNHANCRYNLGAVLARLGNYPGAKVELEKAVALGAVEPEVHFHLAGVLRAMQDTTGARDELNLYQKALKAKADRTMAASKSAEAARESDPQKAAALYRGAFDALPDNAMLAFRLGLALDRTGDTAAERIALERAVQIDPGMAVAHDQLGYLDSQSGDAAAAEQHFRMAVRAAPGYLQAWVSLGATLAMESHLPEAQEAVTRALQIDPQNVDALALRKDLTAAEARH